MVIKMTAEDDERTQAEQEALAIERARDDAMNEGAAEVEQDRRDNLVTSGKASYITKQDQDDYTERNEQANLIQDDILRRDELVSTGQASYITPQDRTAYENRLEQKAYSGLGGAVSISPEGRERYIGFLETSKENLETTQRRSKKNSVPYQVRAKQIFDLSSDITGARSGLGTASTRRTNALDSFEIKREWNSFLQSPIQRKSDSRRPSQYDIMGGLGGIRSNQERKEVVAAKIGNPFGGMFGGNTSGMMSNLFSVPRPKTPKGFPATDKQAAENFVPRPVSSPLPPQESPTRKATRLKKQVDRGSDTAEGKIIANNWISGNRDREIADNDKTGNADVNYPSWKRILENKKITIGGKVLSKEDRLKLIDLAKEAKDGKMSVAERNLRAQVMIDNIRYTRGVVSNELPDKKRQPTPEQIAKREAAAKEAIWKASLPPKSKNEILDPLVTGGLASYVKRKDYLAYGVRKEASDVKVRAAEMRADKASAAAASRNEPKLKKASIEASMFGLALGASHDIQSRERQSIQDIESKSQLLQRENVYAGISKQMGLFAKGASVVAAKKIQEKKTEEKQESNRIGLQRDMDMNYGAKIVQEKKIHDENRTPGQKAWDAALGRKFVSEDEKREAQEAKAAKAAANPRRKLISDEWKTAHPKLTEYGARAKQTGSVLGMLAINDLKKHAADLEAGRKARAEMTGGGVGGRGFFYGGGLQPVDVSKAHPEGHFPRKSGKTTKRPRSVVSGSELAFFGKPFGASKAPKRNRRGRILKPTAAQRKRMSRAKGKSKGLFSGWF